MSRPVGASGRVRPASVASSHSGDRDCVPCGAGPSVNGRSRARKESTRAGRRTQEQSLGAKPKVFNEEDFKRFLERVSAHDAMKKKNHTMPDAMTAGLRPVPLLPLMNGGYCIQGAVYIESDSRCARQLGKVPVWKRMHPHTRPKSTGPQDAGRGAAIDKTFQAFLLRQQDLLRRKDAQLQKTPTEMQVAAKVVKVGQDVIDNFINRKKEAVSQKAARIQQMQEEMIREVCMSTEFAQKAHAADNIQPPDFIDRHYKNVHLFRENSVAKAKARWKVDQPYEAGESKVLDNSRKVTLEEALETHKRLQAHPGMHNREPPDRTPKPVEPVFRVSGNPYTGGKTDRLVEKLGDKACVYTFPASID